MLHSEFKKIIVRILYIVFYFHLFSTVHSGLKDFVNLNLFFMMVFFHIYWIYIKLSFLQILSHLFWFISDINVFFSLWFGIFFFSKLATLSYLLFSFHHLNSMTISVLGFWPPTRKSYWSSIRCFWNLGVGCDLSASRQVV